MQDKTTTPDDTARHGKTRKRVDGVKAAIAVALLILAGYIWDTALSVSAHADPVCDAPGLPPCAPPPDPATLCAVIAWRTWTPCNWYGVQVPQGTPGSWG